jgi:pimeloyl-ACP methyl ester carboxylesterase
MSTITEKTSRFGNGDTPQGLRLFPTLLWLGALLALAGCATPIYTERVSSGEAYRQAYANAIDSDHCSSGTRLVLRRYDLEEPFEKEPEATLLLLHQKAGSDERRDLLCALAELNYLHAGRVEHNVKPWEKKNAPDYYLASALYAYLYLFGDTNRAMVGEFASQTHLARELYNHALAKALIAHKDTNGIVRITGGPRQLPQGRVDLRLELTGFPWELSEFDRFLAADNYKAHGLSVVNRDPGLGSALIGVKKKAPGAPIAQGVPVTIFLRASGGLKQWNADEMTAALELHSGFEASFVEIEGFKVPLETDTTTPLAYAMNDLSVWAADFGRFFSAEETIKSGVYLFQPYQPGRVPVVFVHGTASSPVWWGEMLNTLRADPVLRRRCQFWNYTYNTGNAVALSAANFRDALSNIVSRLDPGGKDPALRQMVVIGHSQGGLLAKMAVTDPGDKLWRAVSDEDLGDVELKPEQRALLERALFFKHVPVVTRAVFICTPHRGSFRASSFVRRLGARLITLPTRLVFSADELLTLQKELRLPREFQLSAATSLESMSPKNPILLELADLPPAASVSTHSIIAVKDPDRVPDADDGVVAYESAHVPYVESELIVHSGHSCQNKPPAIEEVRRILLEHLGSFPSVNP